VALRYEIGAGRGGGPVGVQAIGASLAEQRYLANSRLQLQGLTGGLSGTSTGRRAIVRATGARQDAAVRVGRVGRGGAGGEGEARRARAGDEAATEGGGSGGGGEDGATRPMPAVLRRWKHPLDATKDYEGEWRGDVASGRGVFEWRSGDRYVGQVEGGVAHGWGVLTVAKTGDTYNGSFAAGEMSGWGLMRYAGGDEYEGAFFKGRADGHGYLTTADGDRYSGTFRDGLPSGHGVKAWADGRKYEGEWLAGREHGRGRASWDDGSWCEGDWASGCLHGQGTLVNCHGDRRAFSALNRARASSSALGSTRASAAPVPARQAPCSVRLEAPQVRGRLGRARPARAGHLDLGERGGAPRAVARGASVARRGAGAPAPAGGRAGGCSRGAGARRARGGGAGRSRGDPGVVARGGRGARGDRGARAEQRWYDAGRHHQQPFARHASPRACTSAAPPRPKRLVPCALRRRARTDRLSAGCTQAVGANAAWETMSASSRASDGAALPQTLRRTTGPPRESDGPSQQRGPRPGQPAAMHGGSVAVRAAPGLRSAVRGAPALSEGALTACRRP